ncbi:MAG: hypothetical protein COB84_01915 [Rhodobacteraceae bacterium]|nr:MAG: hypothetical protein COB84_01915 [Paracoccaceae bacterium]
MAFSDLGGINQLLKRFKAAQTEYELFRSIHQEAYDFTAPQRETFRFRSPGQEKNRHVYDSTATEGTVTHVGRIKSATMPSWKEWFKFTAGSIVPEDQIAAVNKDLEAGTKTFFNALNHSNFDTEIDPSLTDWTVGTGAIIMDSGELSGRDLFRFTNVPLAELYPEKAVKGRVRSGWRKQKLPVGHIKQLWPKAKLTDKLVKMIAKNPETEIDVLNGYLFNTKDKLYYNVVIRESEKHILFEQSFNTQRLIIFRADVIPGETFGRGPSIRLLPDIRSLNKIVEFDLRALALNVGGIFTGVNDGIFNPNTVRLAPQTIIPVASNSTTNPTLASVFSGGNAADVEVRVKDLRERIDKAYFANPMGDISDSVRTLGEQMARLQDMLKQRGASLGRLRSELIDRIAETGVDILQELGKFPKIKVDGEQVTLKHTSPLAQAEDLDDFEAIQTWASANIAIVGPEVFMGTAKVEDFPKVTARQLGIPADLIRSDAERKLIGEAAAQAAQSQLGGQPSEG